MKGRLPKPPEMRQRPGRASTRATLHVPTRPHVPPLPPEHEWTVRTLEWWADMWASPMAPEYTEADVHGLYVLAALIEEFWKRPSSRLAGEIRQQRASFGLTPLDRRRLQWEIVRGEEAEQKRAARKPPEQPTADPRAALRALK